MEALTCHTRFGHVGCHFLSQTSIVIGTKLSTARYDIIMARCINWSSKKTQCVVPLSFHSLSNTDLLHRRGLLSHVLFFCLCCSSSSGTDSSAVLTSLGVDTASIERTAQPLWIVVNCGLFSVCPMSLSQRPTSTTMSGDGEGNQWLFYTDKAISALPTSPVFLC